jgi:predicted transposase YdaD
VDNVRKENKNNRSQDSAWKDILDACFYDFLQFFFPKLYMELDLSYKPEFYDKELQKIEPDSAAGNRYVDKLAKVYYKDSTEIWFLVHVEVQGKGESNLPFRLFQYNYRIIERYGKDVVTLLVLADQDPSYRPLAYKREFCGFKIEFRYPYAKLLDYKNKREELGKSRNPFALVIEAFIQYTESKGSVTKLYEAKKYLLVLLFQKAYNKTRIRAVFKFIDWIMRLPEQLEKKIEEDILREQGEKPMAYVTSWERRAEKRGEEKGREKGREEGREKARKETAKRMLKEGWDIEDISRLTGLELEKIRELE